MKRDIIVVGTSAGGIQALKEMVGALPRDLPAAVFIVLHIPAQTDSVASQILSLAGSWTAVHAEDEMPIHEGRIYIAPPDRHLMLEPHKVCVVFGPRENRFRPAIDPLFRSAAKVYGSRVIGVILSGTLDDGCNGLLHIKRQGGLAVVQDPQEAAFPQLPDNALKAVEVDYCVRAGEIPALLQRLASEEARPLETYSGNLETSEEFAGLTCPDCSGPIKRYNDAGILQFRCITGHSYSPEVMRAAHGKSVENALWSAVATLREHANLLRNLAEATRIGRPGDRSAILAQEADLKEQHAFQIESLLQHASHS